MIVVAWILLIVSTILVVLNFKCILTGRTVMERTVRVFTTAIWFLVAMLSYNTIR
jgi:hypothetical protein